jgi:hypothetical protein
MLDFYLDRFLNTCHAEKDLQIYFALYEHEHGGTPLQGVDDAEKYSKIMHEKTNLDTHMPILCKYGMASLVSTCLKSGMVETDHIYLRLACKYNRVQVVHLLLQHKEYYKHVADCFLDACIYGNVKVVQCIPESEAKPKLIFLRIGLICAHVQGKQEVVNMIANIIVSTILDSNKEPDMRP